MSEQDETQVIVSALKRRTELTREAAAVKLSMQSGLSEMSKAVDVSRSFLERGTIVSFKSVNGLVNAQQMAEWMARIVELQDELDQLDEQLRALGVDLANGWK